MPTEFPEIFDPETQEGNSDPLPVGDVCCTDRRGQRPTAKIR